MVIKLIKIFGNLLAAVALLLVAAYSVLFLANQTDVEPSDAIAQISSFQEPRPTKFAGNSYVILMGFAVGPDQDPIDMGVRRIDWMATAGPEYDWIDDPLPDPESFRLDRSDEVADFAEICSDSEVQCHLEQEARPEIAEEWLQSEAWLFDRYQNVIKYDEFQELVPFELLAPMPYYWPITDAQRLLFIQAWQLADIGDAKGIAALLNQDIVFWRMVLKNSDALITKMIAVAYIKRHFKHANQILNRLPVEIIQKAIPSSWNDEISISERSIKRCLAGEWKFIDDTAREVAESEENIFSEGLGITEITDLDRMAWAILKPFWQSQDISNRYAQLMLSLADTFEVPYSEIASAMEVGDKLSEEAFVPFSKPYNFLGDLAMGLETADLSNYAVRVSDLEGMRRGVLLAANLRSSGVSGDAVSLAIQDSKYVDPYTDDPYAWNSKERSIVFIGLERNKRSNYRFYF